MKIVLPAIKVIITTGLAFVNPWLVIPALIAFELTNLKIANQTSSLSTTIPQDIKISNPIVKVKEKTQGPKSSSQRPNFYKKGNKGNNNRFSKTNPQIKSSKPKAQREGQN